MLAGCLALALAITLATGAWPAALATALAGAALALGLKAHLEEGGDREALGEEIAALQDADEAAETELGRLRALIDELAEVLEQVAAEPRSSGDAGEVARLAGELTTMKAKTRRLEELGPISARLDKLENGLRAVNERAAAPTADATRDALAAMEKRMRALEALGARIDTLDAWRGEADSALEDVARLAARGARPAPVPQPRTAPPETPSRAGSLPERLSAATTPERNAGPREDVRSRMARLRRAPEPDAEPAAAAAPEASVAGPVRLTPIFAPALGAPKAFIADAAPQSASAPEALFARAASVARQLAEAGREARLFVRAPAGALADEALLRAAEAQAADAAMARRLSILLPQAALDDRASDALGRLWKRGLAFALEDIDDWSLNIAELTALGLRHVFIDGPVMAQSAQRQGGDPGQLAAALESRNVALVAARLGAATDLKTVAALRPALVAGSGLGPSRVVEAG